MARSLKKGPFADESLLKKVDAMNASGDKSVIKTWSWTSYKCLTFSTTVWMVVRVHNRSTNCWTNTHVLHGANLHLA